MIGTLLGNRYELLEKIGEGGMAEIYKAKCHSLNRYVAVKILKSQYCNDEEFVKKFKREATAAASLSDNNIVDIYDVGSQDNINYIVMEYVDGKNLKQIINEKGRIEYTEAIDIAIQIAKALDCAHKHNLIHRDIKPHNILMTKDGLVKVTDFGIAKVTSSVTITNSNKIIGSAHYFSPEQAKGNFVDCRTDIYSLGIVLYEMVTGRVPYDADSPVSVALKHIQEKAVPPKKIVSSIPESLNQLILKAVEKEPIQRYQTAKEMLTDLERIKNDPDCIINQKNTDDDETRVMDPVVSDGQADKKDMSDDDVYDDAGENGEDNEDDAIKDNKKKGKLSDKKKKIILIASIIIAAIVLGGIVGIIVSSKKGALSNGEVAVPKIIGLKNDEAKKLVEDAGLKFVVSNKKNSDKPEGTVIDCYPPEGTNVKKDSEVRVTVSNGSNGSTVPDLEGYPLSNAKDIIESNGLKLGKVDYEYSDDVQKGDVINQDPSADSPATKDMKINLTVSNGPRNVSKTVPDINGRSIDAAKDAINGAGLSVGKITPVPTDDKSKDGKVCDESPSSGTQVRNGAFVDISYYKFTTEAP